MKGNQKQYILIGLALLIMALATAGLWPVIRWMGTEGNLLLLKEQLQNIGPLGILLFLGIQIAQVIFAIIPGEPVEIAAGMLYGTFGGLLVCLTGVLIGSSVIFLLVRKLGKPFVMRFFSSEKLAGYGFFQNVQKLELLIFLLYLIPGTPKDMLTYVCPLTPISLPRFLLVSTFARIPSVVSSNFAGATLSSGNWEMTLCILAATTLLGLLGILYEKRLTARLNSGKAFVQKKINQRKQTQ